MPLREPLECKMAALQEGGSDFDTGASVLRSCTLNALLQGVAMCHRRLPGIRCPVSCIWGLGDTLLSVHAAQKYMERRVQAPLHTQMVPVGHMILQSSHADTACADMAKWILRLMPQQP